MPIKFVRNDITKMDCDAIVNAANRSLLGGGGVDGAIHAAAGPGLLKECRTLGGCETGKAKITGGYRLPAKYVIHTVGPVWKDGRHGEPELLRSCYRESLALAAEYGCGSVAFPMISAGAYGYPKDQALQIAVSEISSFLLSNEMTVYIVVYDKKVFRISKKLISDIEEYIDEHYVEEHPRRRNRRIYEEAVQLDSLPIYPESSMPVYGEEEEESGSEPAYGAERKESAPVPIQGSEGKNFAPAPACAPKAAKRSGPAPAPGAKAGGLSDALKTIDESFSQMLLRKIDEKGMTDSECYKKANKDRKLFSKIRSDVNYRPSKPTAIAFAIALELPLEELREMLMKAGFALSHSSIFDLIIEYFVKNGQYDIFEINEALFDFDQVTL